MKFYNDYIKDTAALMKVNAKTSPLSYSGAKQMSQFLKMSLDMLKARCFKGGSLMMKCIDFDLEDTPSKYIDKIQNSLPTLQVESISISSKRTGVKAL